MMSSTLSIIVLLLFSGILLHHDSSFTCIGVKLTDSSRRYAIIMDAGSTGTRAHVYSWDPLRALDTLREVSNKRVRIPLSSLVNDPSGINDLLQTLVTFADDYIPESNRATTTIALKATAGLRRLTTSDQNDLISTVHSFFENTQYSFSLEDTAVIPGHEEALYDYLAVMVAMDDATMGVLDLGGASKQLSYVIDTEDLGAVTESVEIVAGIDGESAFSSSVKCTPDYMLRLPGSTAPIGLVTRSIQGMGLLAAMDFIIGLHVEQSEDGVGEFGVSHPCLAVGKTAKGEVHNYDTPLEGHGNVTECYELIRQHFVEKVAAEIDLGCLQKHKPKRFVGLDNFPKLMEMMGLVGGELGDGDAKLRAMEKITPKTVLEAGQSICQISWEALLARFPDSYPAYRAQRACFGAAYIYFFMTDVYGISEVSQGEFFPLDSHEEHNLSWVLGAVAMSVHDNRDNFLSKIPVSITTDSRE